MSETREELWQIVTPSITAGVYTTYKVVRGAPCFKYMIGMSKEQMIAYCRHRGWKVTLVPKEN